MITLSINDASAIQTLINEVKNPSSSAVSALLSKVQEEINSMTISEATVCKIETLLNASIDCCKASDPKRLHKSTPLSMDTKIHIDEINLFNYIIQVNSQSNQFEQQNFIGR